VPGSAPYVKALPDPAALQKAAALLLEAENPLLLVEDGITQNEAWLK
jgi:thiamine pyrophosphate-dependent acetolactate synthase large subunit-like protein